MIKILIQFILFLFPWPIRRFFLNFFFKWEISSSSRIGFSIICAYKFIMKPYSRIGHFNICKKIDLFEIGEYSNMGNFNKITGFSPQNNEVIHFRHIKNRQCILTIGNHSGITSNHYFDCNGGIRIGDFVQIAGFETAFMTHSIDIVKSIQDAGPISIGNYCFIGARCMILKSVDIANHITVSAMSLVNKSLSSEFSLYGGIPCKFLKSIPNAKYFNRTVGKV